MIQIFSASAAGIQTQNGFGTVPQETSFFLSWSHFERSLSFQGCSSAAASPSSIVLGLLLRLPQPGEEGRHRLEGHAFALLLGRVFAGLPLVERVLRDDVLVVQTVEEHPEEICRNTGAEVTSRPPGQQSPPESDGNLI